MNIRQSYRSILKEELRRRKKLNRRYSLRAFARYLGVSPHRLSAVLNGRFGLSLAAAREIADRLGFYEEQASYFCTLVESKHARSPRARAAALKRVAQFRAAELWPESSPVVSARDVDEIALWGFADPTAVTECLLAERLKPFVSAEYGRQAAVAVVVKRSLMNSHPSLHHEFSLVTLVADVRSSEGYGIYVSHHLTDSPALLESRLPFFEKAPVLTSRISLEISDGGITAEVDDESGHSLFECRVAPPPRKKPSVSTFSLVRNVGLSDRRVGRVRVNGISRYRDRKISLDRDFYSVLPGSDLDCFMRRIRFRPHYWRFYQSRYDYFPEK